MNDEFIHILSTGEIPGLHYSGSINFEIVPFLSISLNPDNLITNKVKELSKQAASAVFTSVNAVDAVILALDGRQPSWKIFCIAHATKTRVSEYFKKAEIAAEAPNSAKLADLIPGDLQVIFFCGNLRRDEIPQRMKEKNIRLHELNVYETIYTPVKLQKKYSAILFFSPGAVDSYFSANEVDAACIMYAIGKTTEAAIAKYCHNTIFTAGKPDKLELAQEAINYFEEKINQ